MLAKSHPVMYIYAVKERLGRLKAVRKMIKTYRIESQETLLGYLQK
jgi:transcriptional regulator of arginine metabolism